MTIKNTFKKSIIFGFTGTPIQDINIKNDSTTTDIFGSEVHRYTLAHGIEDGNVLGFDPYKVTLHDDYDMRHEVALAKAKAKLLYGCKTKTNSSGKTIYVYEVGKEV